MSKPIHTLLHPFLRTRTYPLSHHLPLVHFLCNSPLQTRPASSATRTPPRTCGKPNPPPRPSFCDPHFQPTRLSSPSLGHLISELSATRPGHGQRRRRGGADGMDEGDRAQARRVAAWVVGVPAGFGAVVVGGNLVGSWWR